MPRVVILQRTLAHYRVPFYDALAERLNGAAIDFAFVFGEVEAGVEERTWITHVPNRYLSSGERGFVWQPVGAHLRQTDLVIVEQASKLLINYALQLRAAVGGPKLAFWGHGKNLQATHKDRAAEWVKRKVSRRVHWWFAYNDLSKRVVETLGYPSERITSVQNATDTTALKADLASFGAAEKEQLRAELGLTGPVGVYCGRLYADKRLPVLLDAAEQVHARVPSFSLLVVGDGPDRPVVDGVTYPWLKVVGAKYGREKAGLLAVSDVFLLPGLVGLAILDAFAAGLPFITADVPFHSPEIDYLRHGENGLLTRDNVEVFATAVADLLGDPARLRRLTAGALATSERYSTDRMAELFYQGIVQALA